MMKRWLYICVVPINVHEARGAVWVWNLASATEELYLKFYLVLIILNCFLG